MATRIHKRSIKKPEQMLVTLPAPPPGTPATVKKHWQAVGQRGVTLGTIAETDLPALLLCARSLAMVEELWDAIHKVGFTIPTRHEGAKGNPLLRQYSDAAAAALRLLTAFGLTPASRGRVTAAPAVEDDPLTQFGA